jgi:hypothetical protein
MEDKRRGSRRRFQVRPADGRRAESRQAESRQAEAPGQAGGWQPPPTLSKHDHIARVLTLVLLVGIHGRSTEMEAVVASGRGGAGSGLAASVRCGCWLAAAKPSFVESRDQRPEKKT